MTKSEISMMLEIMNAKLCYGRESDLDSRYRGMLDMFSQLICIEDKDTCETVINYFITDNEISGKERTEFAKTVASFDFFIENYEKAIDAGHITANIDARVMLDVFKIFKRSNTMNIVFYEKFGTRANYWNTRLNNISRIRECHEMLNESTINSIIKTDKHTFMIGFVFDDNSKLKVITEHDTVLAHTVIEDSQSQSDSLSL